ncbi:MAG TPA: hypothetical protein VGM19_08335 [Armatimonadota bacterium]|jgi:RNA polymerase sigma-54 factor
MATALALQPQLRPQTTPTVAPQLVAQSALLELDFVELDSRIEQELVDNPALELPEAAQRLRPLLAGSLPSAPSEDGPLGLEDTLVAPYTLRDDLWCQFRVAAPRPLHELGRRLIESVDEAGYLRADLFEVAAELSVPLDLVQAALDVLQQSDPPGLGARSLRECLLLQVRRLRQEGEEAPLGAEAVISALSETPRADFIGQITRSTGLRRAQVQQVLDFVREHLRPYPGQGPAAPSASDSPGAQYPDLIVRRQGDQFLLEAPISRGRYLRLNQAYLELERAQRRLAQSGAAAEEQATLALRRAREFLVMLQRREQVMRQIGDAVVSYQAEFLLHGPEYHRPLSKKQVAALTGLHESTVCRATRGKFLMLPTGEVVSFDAFFESAVPIKRLISSLVCHEPGGSSLSDQDLTALLAASGHVVARRTVAKYRQALGIPSSARRRRA